MRDRIGQTALGQLGAKAVQALSRLVISDIQRQPPQTALMKGFAFPRWQQSGGSDKNSTPFVPFICTARIPAVALLRYSTLGQLRYNPHPVLFVMFITQ